MYKLLYFTVALILCFLPGCKLSQEPVIMTVRGPVSASDMGICLSHEHVLVDFIGADSTGYHRWNRQNVLDRVLPYLNELKDFQVRTLVECTPAYLGRDPLLLLELSKQSGLNLITNTGYYGALQNRFVPSHFYRMDAAEIAAIWVDEFEKGIEDSGVRPGFIKIAVDGDESLSSEHYKIITAAALAHRQTGLVIASHTGPDGPAFEQISVLVSYNIDPSVFIWVHAQNGSLEGNIRAARMGSWISLDNVNLRREAGKKFDVEWYAERIIKLREAGVLDRVLISHDAGWYKPGEDKGGDFRGFTGIFSDLVPALKERNFSDKDIDQILVKNPSLAFSLK